MTLCFIVRWTYESVMPKDMSHKELVVSWLQVLAGLSDEVCR